MAILAVLAALAALAALATSFHQIGRLPPAKINPGAVIFGNYPAVPGLIVDAGKLN